MPRTPAYPPLPATAVRRLMRQTRLVVWDFDGVFTDNAVWVDQRGVETVRCSRLDGIGLSRLAALGISSRVLSTETNPVVAARCRKLSLPCTQGCHDKEPALRKLATKSGLSMEQIAYVGNDINDAGCLQIAGLPIVVADAHPEVLPLARWVTRTPGGHGAVREICDCFHHLLAAK